MILTIFFALLISSITVYFFYWKPKKQSTRNLWLTSILRGFSLFLILLLIIDPKIEVVSHLIEKSNLFILLDQSNSMQNQKKDSITASLKGNIQSDLDLNKNFNISFYSFAKDLSVFGKDSVVGSETNIYQALAGLNDLFDRNKNAIVLLTDGNQNIGLNYTYAPSKTPVYPVVLGDTSTFLDLSIHKVNANRYSFIGQKFPVEVYVQYDGKQEVKKALRVFEKGQQIAEELVELGPNKSSAIVEFKIESKEIGNHFYSVKIDELEGEKDVINNNSPFSVSVIDERAKVLILYKQLHPDIGFWKRMVELNEQREVEIASVERYNGDLSNYKFVILLGFDSSYISVYKTLIDKQINHLIETINGTNYDLLMTYKETLNFEESQMFKSIKVIENDNFTEIGLNRLFLEEYPPLSSKLNNISFNELNSTLWKNEFGNPVLVFQNNNLRSAYLLAENLFQWQSFNGLKGDQKEKFEDYFDGIVQFLQFQNTEQVILDYPKIVFKDNKIDISLKVYDAKFEQSSEEEIILNLTSENDKSVQKLPMIFKNNEYQTNLFLDPGEYNFIVQRNTEKPISGSFQVLDYSAEDRLTPSNYKDLNQLAIHTDGKLFMPNQIDSLKSFLLKSNSFKPIMKEEMKEQSFVDIKWILGLIALSLSLDWFLRKSQGFY